MSIFTGSAVALITPFRNGAVDYKAFDRLIELQVTEESDAIVVCGTTGEASTMSRDERMEAIKHVVDRVDHRIPVIAGTGGNCTAEVIENCRTAEAIGVDGLLVVTPYYNKTTQEGLVVHYNTIADNVDTPILVYNVPSRTGLNLLPETMVKLAEHPNIVGIKEASGNIEQIVRLSYMCPDIDIYSGNDDHVIPLLSIGAKGVISTIANVVPKAMHTLCSLFFDGNLQAAKELQLQLIPLCRAAFCETNPIPIKTMVSLMNICENEFRLPLVPPTDKDLELIANTMRGYGLIG